MNENDRELAQSIGTANAGCALDQAHEWDCLHDAVCAYVVNVVDSAREQGAPAELAVGAFFEALREALREKAKA